MSEKKVHVNVLKRFHYSADQVIDMPFNWVQMSRLFSYLKPYRKKLLPLSALMVIITTAVRLIIPILIGVYTLDKAVKNRDMKMLVVLVGIIAALYVISYIANIFRIRW